MICSAGKPIGLSHPMGWIILPSKLVILRNRRWVWAWNAGLPAAWEILKKKIKRTPAQTVCFHGDRSMLVNIVNMIYNQSKQISISRPRW